MRLTVGPDLAGRRLDAAVGGLEAVESRAEAQRLIEGGRVLVDGRPRPKRHILVEGEGLEVRPAPPAPSVLVPEEVPLVVRYEDEHLLVVDKPAGVVTHPGAGHARAAPSCTGCSATPSRAATTRCARASCTGSTATPRGCWWWRARRAPTGACSGCSATARWTGATSRWCTARPRRR